MLGLTIFASFCVLYGMANVGMKFVLILKMIIVFFIPIPIVLHAQLSFVPRNCEINNIMGNLSLPYLLC